MMRSRLTASAAIVAAVGGGAVALVGQSAEAGTVRSASAASAAALKLASVKVASGTSSKTHRLLVDSKGLPIYLLTGDSKSHPECESSGCLGAWPAVTSKSKKPALGKGVKGKVGVWHHGKLNQVTLNGHPLYTYIQDGKGAASGEGLKSFGGVWEVVTASGSGMAAAAGGGSGSSGSSGSSGGSSDSGW